MSNKHRQTEKFFRKYEAILVEAFALNVELLKWSFPCGIRAGSGLCVDLHYATKYLLEYCPQTTIDIVHARTVYENYKWQADVLKGLVETHVVLRPRVYRSNVPRRLPGASTYNGPPIFTNAEDQNRIEDLKLNAEDRLTFRTAIRSVHLGLVRSMIILHGNIQPWMQEELDALGPTVVEYHPGPEHLSERVIII